MTRRIDRRLLGGRGHSLADLPGVASNEVTSPIIEFWDTAGAGWDEELEQDGESKLNPREANWVITQSSAVTR